MDLLGILTASHVRYDELSRSGDRRAPEPGSGIGPHRAGGCDHLRASIDLYTEVMMVRSLRPSAEPTV